MNLWPKTVEQAVDCLLKTTSDSEKDFVAKQDHTWLVRNHHCLGRYIRNDSEHLQRLIDSARRMRSAIKNGLMEHVVICNYPVNDREWCNCGNPTSSTL